MTSAMHRGKRTSNPRGRGGFHSKQTTSPRGLFVEGVWHCECQPRLPAEHFRVKKEGKNKGRWFYTCQQNEPLRCGFFLWEDDARPREEAAVLGNSRTEPGRSRGEINVQPELRTPVKSPVTGKGLFAGGTEQANDASTQHLFPSPMRPSDAGGKRKADAAGLSDDEDDTFDWTFSKEDERLVARVADTIALETPRKALKTGVYATPGDTSVKRKLPWLEEPDRNASAAGASTEHHLETPSKPPAMVQGLCSTTADPTTPEAPPSMRSDTVMGSPSPLTRHRDALADPDDSESPLTAEVLATLYTSKFLVPADVLSKLRGILTKHDLRAKGVMKGRDISRLAVKARDARIIELQARITGLEAEREVDRAVIRSLRTGVGDKSAQLGQARRK